MRRVRDSDEPYEIYLRQLFRGAALGVLAGSAAGCGDPTGAPLGAEPAPTSPAAVTELGVPSEGESPSPASSTPTCMPMWMPLGAIAPVVAVDYVAWTPRPSAATTIERGIRCETATQPKLCEAQFEEAAIAASMVAGVYMLTTTGDEVRVLRGDDILEFLGVVDTADEALIAALLQGHAVECWGPKSYADPWVPQLGVDATATGFELRLFPPPVCSGAVQNRLSVSRDGVVELLEARVATAPCPVMDPTPGRPPAGLVAASCSSGRGTIGEALARDAHLEAASVDAFEILAAELKRHGAPSHFRRAALDAASDEVRHANATARLAARFGAEPPRVEIDAVSQRGFAEMALDNAVEGCVGETYAAMRATFQSLNARDAQVRGAMRQIAEDETRHAALSWKIRAWTLGKLTPRARRDVRVAQRRKLAALRAGAMASPAVEVRSTLGLPNAWQAQRLLDHLERALLAA